MTYAGMLWLTVSQILVLVLYVGDVPIWLLPIAFLTAAWRIRQIRQGRGHTPWYIIVGLVLLGLGSLVLSGHTQYSLDSAVALAVLGYSLKNIEANDHRDALFNLMLGYVLVGFSFLYDQTMIATLLALCAVIIITTATIGVRMLPGHAIWVPFRLAATMVLLSAPLMLGLFVFVPRLPPIWNIPIKSGQATAGVTEEIGFGDVAKLAGRHERAFRVDFRDRIPPRDQWYWRGLVYTDFDGYSWKQKHVAHSSFLYFFNPENLLANEHWMLDVPETQQYHYQVLLEKTNQRWLFTLDVPVQYDTGRFNRYKDFRLVAKQEILAPIQYDITSHVSPWLGATLSVSEKADALALPADLNPKTRAWSERERAHAASDVAFIQRVLQYLQNNAYFYTLKPDVLTSRHRVDAFWFDSKRGFCSHYASSFVVIMRAAGIPARMVGGYLGGEWNTIGNYVVVRQSDAHAWGEVWLQDKGWVRVDPTAAIAPHRIEQTLQDLMPDSFAGVSAVAIGLRRIGWVNRLQQRLDHLQFYWQRWVINYTYDDQMHVLRSILGNMTTTRVVMLFGSMIIGFFVVSSLLLGIIKWHKMQPIEQRLWSNFHKCLAKRGLKYQPEETIGQYCQRASRTWLSLAEHFQDIQKAFEQLYYSNDPIKPLTIRRLKRYIKQLKHHRTMLTS